MYPAEDNINECILQFRPIIPSSLTSRLVQSHNVPERLVAINVEREVARDAVLWQRRRHHQRGTSARDAGQEKAGDVVVSEGGLLAPLQRGDYQLPDNAGKS